MIEKFETSFLKHTFSKINAVYLTLSYKKVGYLLELGLLEFIIKYPFRSLMTINVGSNKLDISKLTRHYI